MFRKTYQYFVKNWPILLLIGFEIILFLLNYQKGTWLLGWDNTTPEFNLSLNFFRNLSSVWQEYRGLGLLDGMAYAANLAHTTFISLLSLLLPNNLVRYFFHFFAHFLGGLGVYFLILSFWQKSTDKIIPKLSALSGAFFYLLNWGVIQMFYTPLEVFSFHFAALPWTALTLLKFLNNGQKIDFWLFCLVSFLIIPQGFVPTLFVVYMLLVGCITVFYFRKVMVKRLFAVILVIFAVNSFWLLPYVYGLPFSSVSTSNSKINQMSNENILLMNKKFGSFATTALMQGFSLEVTDRQINGKANLLMAQWQNHMDKLSVILLAWIFFGLMVLGIIFVIVGKQKQYYPFLLMFLIAFLILGNDIPWLSMPFNFLVKFIPFFKEGFRFVFTKFIFLYAFAYSILTGLGIGFLLKRLLMIKRYKGIGFFLAIIFLIGLFFYSRPVFQGEFFYSNLKVELPTEYIDLTNFFKTKNYDKRLLVLPQPEFWGWSRYSWGYRGSGFIWQALPQASMDGAFLPWSVNNENFYWQISRAIYAKNIDLLESVLEKYQISWLIIDGNIQGGADPKALFLAETKAMFGASGKIHLLKTFGKIQVYQVSQNKPVKDYVWLAENLPVIGPNYIWNDDDTAYLENGDYLSQSVSEVFYPFRSLFTGRKQDELEFEVKDEDGSFTFSRQFPEKITGFSLQTPQLLADKQFSLSKNLEKEKVADPKIVINGNSLAVRVKKIRDSLSYDSRQTGELFKSLEARNCNSFNVGFAERKVIEDENSKKLRLVSKDSSNCLNIDLSRFSHQQGYLIKIIGGHTKGKPLLISLTDKTFQRRQLETYLPKEGNFTAYFIVPPMTKDGLGYSLNFDNISIGRQETINDLQRVEVYQIPYDFLKQIKLVKKNKGAKKQPMRYLNNFTVQKSGTWFYRVSLGQDSPVQADTTLVLSQSFDKGWLGLYFDGFKPQLLTHALVNNWANGWRVGLRADAEVGPMQVVYLVFWPQLLQFVGFGILLGFGFWLWRTRF